MAQTTTTATKRAKAEAERAAALAHALAHPLRHRMFVILAEREASPTEMGEELGAKLHTVMYHCRWLAALTKANRVPLIEMVGTDRKRGGLQHFWKAVERPMVDVESARHLPRWIREDSSASFIPKVIEDLMSAQEAGTFDSHPERSLLRMHIELDDEGMARSGELAEEHLQKLRDLAAESKNRLARRNETGIAVATETLIFQVPKLY